MKQKACMGIVLLLVSSLVLAGCARDISQEDYDDVVAERDTAQAQITSLSANLTTAEAQIESLSANLTTTQAEIESLQADLAAAEERFDALYIDQASLALEHRELEARYEQLVEDFRVVRPEYEERSLSALPTTITAGNLDIILKEAQFADRVAGFGPLGKFVVLTMEVTNISRTEEYIFAASFLLIGRERKLYQSYNFGYNTPTEFIWNYKSITAEATLECKLAFDVPADEYNLYLLVTIEPELELWPTIALGL